MINAVNQRRLATRSKIKINKKRADKKILGERNSIELYQQIIWIDTYTWSDLEKKEKIGKKREGKEGGKKEIPMPSFAYQSIH